MTAIQAHPEVDGPPEPILSAEAKTTAFLTDAYRDHRGAVYDLAQRVCGTSGAEDVVQEVFIRLWRNPDRFDPARGSLRAFMLAMTHTMAVDRVRSSTARRRREERSVRLGYSLPTDVETAALAHAAREQIVAAMATLPDREKEAILTAFYGRGTYRDAARILGQPEGTVKGRIRAGLKRLEVALADKSDSGLI
ncbi:MAG: sigma-70 family RNA polymerase sigma factor [Acidimicrobiales bacterium]